MKLILLVLALVQPVHSAESERLAAHIVTVQPGAVMYARPLANAIYRESAATGLDPTVVAAVVWMESWYDRNARGSDHERGLYQLYPLASHLGLHWEYLRRSRHVPRHLDRPWFALSVRLRQEITRDIDLGAALAVALMRIFVGHCRRKHRDHRRPTDSYAHYNSGFRWPRPGYSHLLWQRTQRIRRAVGGVAVTDAERAWLSR